MDSLIKVSVIVPVYNVKDYLNQCVDSLLSQTMNDFEIILVDDGSTDGSGEMCDDYSRQYEKVRSFHKTNGGQGSARNFGVQHSLGEYIYFLDSDDWLVENALERLYIEAKEKQLDVLAFGANVFYENDLLKTEHQFNYHRTVNIGVVCSGAVSLKKVIDCNEYLTSICLRLYDGDYYKKHNFVFDEKYIHEDEDFGFLSYLLAERVEIISDNLYIRRVRNNSTMTGKTIEKSVYGYYNSWNSVLNYAEKNDDKLKAELCATQMVVYTNLVLELYHKSPKNNKKEIRDKCKEMCKKTLKYKASKKIKLASFSIRLCDWMMYVVN